jgi:hypothetical protein
MRRRAFLDEIKRNFYSDSSLKDRPEMRWGSLASSSKKILRCATISMKTEEGVRIMGTQIGRK